MIIQEFKAKGNKIRFEAYNEILEKTNHAISSIQKGNVEKCQETLQNGNKWIPIADREEDDYTQVVKSYLSEDLTSDSGNEKQLLRVRGEAASNKKKRDSAKQKERKKQF